MPIEAKQSANPRTLELYIYSDIQGDYFDFFDWKKVTSETSSDYVRMTLAATGGIDHINLYVNSFGGSVKEALGIYAQLRRHPAKVTGYVDGYAASAASVVLMACDHIVMGCNTVQMIHYPWCTVTGNPAELRKCADDLEVLGTASEQAYLERAAGKLTREKLAELMTAETYLDAKTCLELGLCDEISNTVVDMDAAKAKAAPPEVDKNGQSQRLADLYARQFGGKPQPEPEPKQKCKAKVKVVTGAPCSGKTTYVSEHIGDHDLVYDYDALSRAMSNSDEHRLDREHLHKFVMDVRYSIIDRLANTPCDGLNTAWLIVTSPNDKFKEAVAELSPEYIEMTATEAECLERLEKDDTRPEKAEWAKRIRQWFAENRPNADSESEPEPTPEPEQKADSVFMSLLSGYERFRKKTN